MAKSKIEWTDVVWNPTTGCTKVSQGCKHCYAETIANRFWATQYPPNADGSPRKFTDVRLHPERLEEPRKWRKPRRVFVNSMSDLFHEDVPDDFIAAIWMRMIVTPRHTYQILTKRPQRMAELVPQLFREFYTGDIHVCPNVWLGVSVEDQKTADERIPILLQTPAAVRFVSYEPALGPVDFTTINGVLNTWSRNGEIDVVDEGKLHWIIMGGESGPGARPLHPDWARSTLDQCLAAGVPFFFKQWGEWTPYYPIHKNLANIKETWRSGRGFWRVGKKAAGRMLDGRTWDEFPGGE